MKLKEGKQILTKEFGLVTIETISPKGEIVEINKDGEIIEVINKTITILTILKAIWLQIEILYKSIFNK